MGLRDLQGEGGGGQMDGSVDGKMGRLGDATGCGPVSGSMYGEIGRVSDASGWVGAVSSSVMRHERLEILH